VLGARKPQTILSDRNCFILRQNPFTSNQNLKTCSAPVAGHLAAAQTLLMHSDARARRSPPLAVRRKKYGPEAFGVDGARVKRR
jgi:hypothetical protein